MAVPDTGIASGLSGAGNSSGSIANLFPKPVQGQNASSGTSLSVFRYDTASGTWLSENGNQRIGILVTGNGRVILSSANGSAGLQLAGIGRARESNNSGVSRIRAEGNRLELDRGTIREWYTNRGNGIEQGMTVNSRPAGNGTLAVDYTLSGDLRPVLAGQTLVFFDANGPVLNYGGLAAYDAAGRELPAALSLSHNTLTWQIDDRNAVYPIVIDPWIATQAATLTASDAAGTGTARFGNAVAISGDTAIIGAYAATVNTKTYAGQAYIFTNSGGTWSETAILNASDAAGDASFGQSVAISGNTAVIGAYHATADGNFFAGQAYVFTNSGGTWSETAILNASDASFFAEFGSSAAISGDGNTAIIGAPGSTVNAKSSAGQAYVFTNSGGTWSETAILNASDAADSATFGSSVAISDDGITAIIGASGVTVNAKSSAGQAYVFTNTGGTWIENAILNASDAQASAYFGSSVAVSDYGNTAVIGAYGFNSSAGQAYVFTGSGGTWIENAILNATDVAASSNFGSSVAISGNGDTSVIGSPYATVNYNSQAGKTYVFKANGATWSQSILLTPSDITADAYFGSSVGLSGDGENAAIGAYQFNSYTGQAYIFRITSSAPQVYGITPSSWPNTEYKTVTVSGNGFNSTVAPVLNLTRPGYSNISVTAWMLVSTQSFWASIPSGKAAGVWNVTVVNPDGEEGTNASVTFTITAPPILTGISPVSGANTAATLVTVTGTQFNSTVAPIVNLTRTGYSDITLTGTNLSATSFTVSVPQDLDRGVWNVVVINPDGLQGTNTSVAYTVLAPPRLTGISPAYGANATATLVTITGSWFNSTVAPVVNLSSAGHSNITLTGTNLSTTRFTVTVPNHNIAAVWNVTVINPDGQEGTNASVTFTTTDPPPVAEFSYEPAAGLASLTVTFTDQSINVPESWLWDFGDGDTTNATEQDPVHTYAKPGIYTVKLSATNYLGTGTKTVQNVITVMGLGNEMAILNASSDAATDDRFGSSVALSGDGNTALVAAEWTTIGTTPPGKVYVFTESGGIWSRSAVLQPGDGANNDEFGNSLAFSGDGNTVLIGAPNADVGSTSMAGKVYVFTNSGGIWSEAAILNASDASPTGYFGSSVALSGDTALIGSKGADQVYVFRKLGTSWSEQQILAPSDVQSGDWFGNSLAISDDGNTAIIGASEAEFGSFLHYPGKAYIFTNGGGTWSESAMLTASDADDEAMFGYAVALSGDGNTAFIGAMWATVGPTQYSGKAYIFTNSGGTWSESAILSAPEAVNLQDFGISIVLSGDMAVIGNPGKTIPSTPGRAYVYRKDGNSWFRTHVLKVSDATDSDNFGNSVAVSGNTVLVGAPVATSGTTDDAGQAYFFTVSPLAPVVAGISPSSGANATATLVTIAGTGFNSTAAPVIRLTRTGYSTITMSGTNLSSTSFTVTVPAHEPAGVRNVTVINPDGQEGTSPSVTYTVIESIPAPEVTGIDPSWGINTSDTTVTITGSYFNTTIAPVVNLTRTGYANVTLGVVSGTGTSIVRTVPAHTDAGTWNVVVVNPDGQEGTNASVTFLVTETIPAPVVAGISPSWGVNTSETTVTITGSYFNTTTAPVVNLTRTGYANVTLGGVGSTSTALVRTVPANTGTGTWNLVVINPDGQEGTNASVTFTVTDGTSPPSTPATDTESSSGDSATSGRPGTYTAGSPGATAGGTMTFSINEPVTANAPWAVISISLVPSTTLGSTDIIVSDIGTMPPDSLAGRTTAGISDITLIGVNPSSVSQGTITFAVSGPWLTAHGLNTGDIVVMRNHAGAWIELTTTFDHQTGDTYYFTATTPGFSYFAVTTRTNTTLPATTAVDTSVSEVISTGTAGIPVTATGSSLSTHSVSATKPVAVQTTDVPADGVQSSGSSGIPVLAVVAGIAGIGIAAVAVVLYRRRKRFDPLG